jgi:23S rRNA (adenine2503-C2)-methyltransferase
VIKEKLYGKTLDELVAVTKKAGLPGYSAKQMADWLYRKEINTIDEMTNLSKKMREKISSEYEIGLSAPADVSESRDGTKKYLFKVLSDKYIESAFIPGKNRATLCVSCQAGCRMACIFCMTGRQHFQGNLSSNEILNQFRSIPEFSNLTNIVFMGMGEPLDNIEEVLKSLEILTSEWGYGWSPTRITLSTIGLKNRIREFLEKSRCHLALSLHSPFDRERARLMPVQKSSPVREIIDIIREYDFSGQRRLSFEYILFSGLNDTPAHIKELARLTRGLRCRINIIRFHEIPGTELKSPAPDEAERFRDALNKQGIPATVRASRGEDIGAACGLLSTLEQNKQKINQ